MTTTIYSPCPYQTAKRKCCREAGHAYKHWLYKPMTPYICGICQQSYPTRVAFVAHCTAHAREERTVNPEPYYIVVRAAPLIRQALRGTPTPRLIDAGSGDAYYVASDDPNWPDGHWRLRDDAYDAPGTVYTRVRVIRNPADRSPFDGSQK